MGIEMNVLFVSDVSISKVIGGAERVIYEQGTRLAKRGHRVVHMTRMAPEHRAGSRNIDGVLEYRYSVDWRTPLFFLSATLRNGGRLFEYLERKFGFAAIIFHQPFSAMAVCAKTAARKKRKVYTCHSLAFEEYASRNPEPTGTLGKLVFQLHVRFRKWMERCCLARSDRICVLSEFTKEKLRIAHGVESEKVTVIPGGVDLKRFRPARDKQALRRSLGLPADRFVLLTVRNLVPRMGLENLIMGFSKAVCTVPELFLVIGGHGPLRPELSKKVDALGLGDHVRFVGFVPERRLSDYYAMADLFVLPTRELEGFGLVTVESLACATPVLGTPVGGTTEILGDFEPELLFDNISADAMASKMSVLCAKFINEPSSLESLSRRCRQYAEDRYSWDDNVRALEKLLAG